ncbi:MAG: DUF2207 domain-containing protein [Clostridiales Family XIII bacterium]|jgi:type II secretory pathway pseudopilin PulG|nr:DUF2207 domain-containing protein [Clostridiales Family XIII bacterium]
MGFARIAVLAIAFLAATPGVTFAAGGQGEATREERSAGMVTRAFDVDVVVQKDNSFLVTETITVDFLEYSHGIYRNFPVRGEAVQQYEGKTVTMGARMEIEGVTARVKDRHGNRADAPVKLSRSGRDLTIRVGDEDITQYGSTTYTITYHARLYDDKIPDYDLIYWNALPTDWETPIRSSTVTFTIPGAGTDVDGAEFIAGLKGQADTDRFGTQTVIDSEKDAVVITATAKDALATGKA